MQNFRGIVGEIYSQLGQVQAAQTSYDRALCLTQSELEKKMLQQKIQQLPQ